MKIGVVLHTVCIYSGACMYSIHNYMCICACVVYSLYVCVCVRMCMHSIHVLCVYMHAYGYWEIFEAQNFEDGSF